MENSRQLIIYNTLTRRKENFVPIVENHVGMYLCGPTVYGDPHLGHARSAICFDVLFRLFTHLGFKVRYVRNITDVGHLENDADEGEDKIAKKARVEQLEPMEVAQFYTNSYHRCMDVLNVLRPSIEPRASGHIPEQIELVETMIAKGMAYESEGSVYFNVPVYAEKHAYGILSGRKIEDAQDGGTGRDLDGQESKRSRLDFALWKKAEPTHIMRWKSPWGDGFPGWHIECTAMSTKYLGKTFDIHCGGMDLLFPHHECEIAQSQAALGQSPAKYWMHNNMITVDGQKMGKSLGNFITLDEFFTGKHNLLSQAFSPMAIRFFILQAHYRSTLDFSDEALQAAEKGYRRLMAALKTLQSIKTGKQSTVDVKALVDRSYEVLLDDMNTPLLVANLFEAVSMINKIQASQEQIDITDHEILGRHLNEMVFHVLGLTEEAKAQTDQLDGLIRILINQRSEAKARKDFAASDAIRDQLAQLGVKLKDSKEGTSWDMEA
jgi:cysteinyl-tRNA synthetase